MNAQRLGHLLTHPVYTVRLLAYRVYEWRHPDDPWLAQGAVRYCDEHLDREGEGIEWGSGRSTLWFAKRLRKLTSVEQDASWAGIVRARLAKANVSNVDYRHVAVEPSDPTDPDGARSAYVRVIDAFADDSLALAIVDGHYRDACIAAALRKLRPGGLLLVDNTDWAPLEKWGVPSDWPVVHQSRNVRTQTTIWAKPANR